MTLRGTARTLYLNGRQINSDTYSGTISSTSSSLFIGMQDRNGYTYPYTGDMYDVRIWKKALSAQEVFDFYRNPYANIWIPKQYWFLESVPPTFLQTKIKIGGNWKSAIPKIVKVNGVYKEIVDGKIKVSGNWKSLTKS